MQNSLSDVKAKLVESITTLRRCVDLAAMNIFEKYGNNHALLKRIESYYPGIEKSIEYVNMIEKSFLRGDFVEAQSLSEKVCAISEMIRTDASGILLLIDTGFDELPDSSGWN